MAVKTKDSLLLNKNGLFSNDIRQLWCDSKCNEEIDIAWISEAIKQDLNLSELDQMLTIIDDFIEQKKAETTAEIQLVDAFRSRLLEKRLTLEESGKPVNSF